MPEHRSFAAGKDKGRIAKELDPAPENSLNVLLFVVSHLLELVDGDNAALIGFLQVGENLVQRCFRAGYFPDTHGKGRHSGRWVQGKDTPERHQ